MKKTFSLVLIAVCLPLFVSCAKESEPEDTPLVIDLKSDSTQCLTEISSTFSLYIDGDLSEAALREFWLCTRDALQLFLDVTKGKKSGNSYSSHEIKRFLEEYFLDGYVLSPALVDEVMHLKRLFVAGSLTEVTRPELTALQSVISEIEELTVDLRPYVPTIAKAMAEPENIKLGVSDVEVLEARIKDATRRFSTIAVRHGQDYSVARLQSLVSEVEKVFTETSPEDSLAKFFPLVEQAKLLLVNKSNPTTFALNERPESSLITAEEWPRLMSVAADLLGYFLRYRLFVEQADWRKDKGLEQLHHIIISAEGLLRTALGEREQPHYDTEELIGFVDSLRPAGLLPEQFDAPAVKSVVEVLTNKFLAVGSEPYETNKFSLSHLNQLRFEYWRWKVAQDYLGQMDVQGFKLSATSSDPGVEEMRRVLSGPWAMVQDDLGRLVFSFDAPEKSNLSSRSILNLLRAGIRLIIQGYASEADRKTSLEGITKDELLSVEEDLHPLLQALGLVKEGESIAGRLYLEANLFMPRANGDELLGFEEGIEYLSFVLSGLSASGQIFDELKLQCPTLVEDGTTKIAIDCFRSKVSENRKKYLAHLPHLVTYLDLGTSDLWKSIEINLERALRDEDLSLPISQGEVLQMWVLLQYVETFFGRFDANTNTSVDLSEALESYKIFKTTLEDLLTGALSDEDGVLAFFTFTMRYGETPFTAQWGGELKFLNWKWSKEKWTFEANRLRVLKILAALNELI